MNKYKTIKEFICSWLFMSVMAVSLFSSSVIAGEFRTIGSIPNSPGHSQAFAVSPDGKTIVGASSSSTGYDAVRWTLADGLEVVGDLAGGSNFAQAFGITDDGSLIVGRANSSLGVEGFRWNHLSGLEGIGDLPGGKYKSIATAVSANGSVIVGIVHTSGGQEAMRWTSSEGLQALGDLPSGLYESQANDISEDGIVIVGYAHSSQGKEAFRWIQETGMVALDDISGGLRDSTAFAISRDGVTVVGRVKTNLGYIAVRWVDNTPEALIDTNKLNLTNSRATAVSGNGAVIAGSSDQGVFVWDKVNGARLLKDVLLHEYGVDLARWFIIDAGDISADGSTIVGSAINPSSRLEGYVAKIDLVNTPPVANAGIDQTVFPGTEVALDGSNSTDPDGDFTLKYHWNISYKPQGSMATLSNPDIVNPVLVTDVVGDYVVDLVVTDSFNEPSKIDSVIISTVNSQPVAKAGVDQSVILHCSDVELNGGESHDPDGDSIFYKWSFVRKPINSKTMLNSDSVINPIFVADVRGTYELELVVADTYGFVSKPDTVVISFNNLVPVAQAGDDQGVFAGLLVVLNGDQSSDANLDNLTYHWILVSVPEGSTATITNENAVVAEFVPDMEGTYVVGLVANDGLVDSEMDNMMITAIEIDSAIMESLDKMIDVVNNMDPLVFSRLHEYRNDDHNKGSKHKKGKSHRGDNRKHEKGKSHRDDKHNDNRKHEKVKSHRNDERRDDYEHHGKGKHSKHSLNSVLVKKLESVKSKIANADFEEAIEKLNNDVMKRFDGCTVTGDIDKNDWVRDCSAQESVYPIGVFTRDLLKLLVK